MEELPIIALKKLAGNPPTSLSPLQVFLAEYIEYLHAFWWTAIFATMTFLLIDKIIRPLFFDKAGSDLKNQQG